MKAVEEVGKYRTEIAKLQTGKMLELRKSLTDEQIKKLEQERRQRACSRMGSRSKGKRDDGKRGVNRLRGDRRDRRDQPARGGKARGR